MIHDRCRATVEVLNERVRGVDAKVMVDRGEEITGRTNTFDGIFAAFVGGTDDAAGFNSTRWEQIDREVAAAVAVAIDSARALIRC